MLLEISPSLFYKYAKSPHWIWYDLFGDKSKKAEMPELTKRLIEDGVLHEEEYVKDLPKVTVDTKLSEDEAEKLTLKYMKTGEELIYQGVISYSDNGVKYKGRPDFLKKCDGSSNFGGYYYIPVEIKNSTKCEKAEYKKQLMLYAMILEHIQGFKPNSGEFINKKHGIITCDLDEKLFVQTHEVIQKILNIMKGDEPSLKISSVSKQTPWYDVLLEEAKNRNDIALIYNISAKSLDNLREEGISTLNDMSAADIDTLPKIKGASYETILRAKNQAQALIDNKIIKLSDVDIPTASTEIYFDIEGDPLLGIEYLFGLLIYRSSTQQEFKYFLARTPGDEREMWDDFLSWINYEDFNDVKIYHYHSYEKTALSKLSKKYGTNNNLSKFSDNLVDLFKYSVESYIFPVYFYSIKDIAKYLNFKWQHEKAGGAQSIFWYEQWLETGDKNILQDIINYNEDDVRATQFLKQWFCSH